MNRLSVCAHLYLCLCFFLCTGDRKTDRCFHLLNPESTIKANLYFYVECTPQVHCSLHVVCTISCTVPDANLPKNVTTRHDPDNKNCDWLACQHRISSYAIPACPSSVSTSSRDRHTMSSNAVYRFCALPPHMKYKV